MKRTIDVDDDALQSSREIASNPGTTVGPEGESIRNGVPLMPRRSEGSPLITMETVNHLRDES